MLGSPLPRIQSVRTRSVGPGSTRNSVSNLYSGPRRARLAAAVTSLTLDAGFIRASASLLKTTLPSSRLTSWTPRRASRKGARWARSRRVFFSASRSAPFGGAAAPAARLVERSAATRKGRQGDKRAALQGERPMDGSSPAGLHGRKVGRALTRPGWRAAGPRDAPERTVGVRERRGRVGPSPRGGATHRGAQARRDREGTWVGRTMRTCHGALTRRRPA